jgi:carboxymethylenebutenolidase
VVAGYADHDPSMPPEAIATVDRLLTENGIPHHTAVYPDAPHGYTMADTSMYQESGAERAFEELRALFGQQLNA